MPATSREPCVWRRRRGAEEATISDPVSPYLEAGERIVWRHQPDSRTLFCNRLPNLVIVLPLAGFVAWACYQVVGNALPDRMPTEFSVWLIIPAGFVGFALYLLYWYAVFIRRSLGSLLDSSSTHYALTDRRFMIVSARGVIEYDASYFEKMEAGAGAPGAEILLFNWGPAGRRRRSFYRDRIAALPDAKALERLIRATLRP